MRYCSLCFEPLYTVEWQRGMCGHCVSLTQPSKQRDIDAKGFNSSLPHGNNEVSVIIPSDEWIDYIMAVNNDRTGVYDLAQWERFMGRSYARM